MYKRKFSNRETRPYFLVLTEGEKTEVKYFKGFLKLIDRDKVRIDIEGLGISGLELLRKSIRKRKYYADKFGIRSKEIYTWCVFDKNTYGDDCFNNSIAKASSQKINVAFSNECFELWFYLHFFYCDSQICRSDISNKLNKIFLKKFNKKYNKNDGDIFCDILNYQSIAIKNARKLCKLHGSNISYNPAACNPATTVFQLVEEINKFIIK